MSSVRQTLISTSLRPFVAPRNLASFVWIYLASYSAQNRGRRSIQIVVQKRFWLRSGWYTQLQSLERRNDDRREFFSRPNAVPLWFIIFPEIRSPFTTDFLARSRLQILSGLLRTFSLIVPNRFYSLHFALDDAHICRHKMRNERMHG